MPTSSRSSRLTSYLICCALTLAPGIGHAAILLQDFFTDDTAGSAPNGPDIGSAFYGSGGNVVHSIIDLGGDRKQQIVSPGPAGTQDNGSSLVYTPTLQPQKARVAYEFRVASAGLDQVGVNAHLQELIFDPLGLNLFLFWASPANSRHLVLGTTQPGGQTIAMTDTGVVYAPDTSYAVEWLFDMQADTWSVSVDGNPLATGTPFGIDGDALRQLAFQNNFATIGTQVIDNVLIESIPTVPEPSSLALLAAAFIALGIAIRLQA